MTFSFNLHWNELSEELREQKIDEYIKDLAKEGLYKDSETEELMTETEALNSEEIRERAEEAIEMHFPIYF